MVGVEHLGSYGGPTGGTVSYERGTPVKFRVGVEYRGVAPSSGICRALLIWFVVPATPESKKCEN